MASEADISISADAEQRQLDRYMREREQTINPALFSLISSEQDAAHDPDSPSTIRLRSGYRHSSGVVLLDPNDRNLADSLLAGYRNMSDTIEGDSHTFSGKGYMFVSECRSCTLGNSKGRYSSFVY